MKLFILMMFAFNFESVAQQNFCSAISDADQNLLKIERLVKKEIVSAGAWQTYDEYELAEFPSDVQLVVSQYAAKKEISVFELLSSGPSVYDFKFGSGKDQVTGLYLEVLIDEAPFNVNGAFYLKSSNGYREVVSFEDSFLTSCDFK